MTPFKNSEFDEKTKRLKELIYRAKKSAREAWQAGGILSDIKEREEYKISHRNFSSYTKKEFGIAALTANQYIAVHRNIPLNEITDNMLVTHLYLLIDMEAKRRSNLLAAISHLDIKRQDEKQTGEVVYAVRRLLECAKEHPDQQEIKNLITEFTVWKKQVNKTRKRNRKLVIRKELTTKHFPQIKNLYPNEPIDEQGTIGLFCTIFHLIKDKYFLHNGEFINFSTIVYIRTQFPDAKIEFKDLHQNPRTMDIEFEFDSKNYFTHKHHKSDKTCEMIICWKHNMNSSNFEMPPVLSIENLLNTGEIVMIFS